MEKDREGPSMLAIVMLVLFFSPFFSSALILLFFHSLDGSIPSILLLSATILLIIGVLIYFVRRVRSIQNSQIVTEVQELSPETNNSNG